MARAIPRDAYNICMVTKESVVAEMSGRSKQSGGVERLYKK